MAWDPDADVKAGNQCKPFGAAAIMRLPTRMQIAWVDDSTLKLDWDLGTQTPDWSTSTRRRQPGARSLQGHAIAEWIDVPAAGRGGRGGGGGGGAAPAGDAAPAGGARGAAPAAAPAAGAAPAAAEGAQGRGRGGAPGAAPAGRGAGRGAAAAARPGGLKIVTNNLQPQYLRMNGVPISEKAMVTDYLDIIPGVVAGEQWLIVRTTVEDPAIPVAGLHHEPAVQAGGERVEVEPDAVRASPAREGHGHAGASGCGRIEHC